MKALSDIGAALVATRRAAGMTQAELGARIGASQQQIARWESREYRNVDLERVSGVAEALGVSADELVGGASMVAETKVAYRAGPPVPSLVEAAFALRAFFATRDDVVAAWVFGSVAAGTAGPMSDVDVAVLAPPDFDREARWELRMDLVGHLQSVFGGRDVDVLVVPDAPPLTLHRAIVNGVRVYGSHSSAAAEAEIVAAASYFDFRPVLDMKDARLTERLRGHGGSG